MQTIMGHIIDESEKIHESLLHVLLSALARKETVSAFNIYGVFCYFVIYKILLLASACIVSTNLYYYYCPSVNM
jgi:hypothetical protein